MMVKRKLTREERMLKAMDQHENMLPTKYLKRSDF